MADAVSSQMGSAPIPLLLLRFVLPALAGSLANALYNIVDRAFIGHYVGATGLAAVSVVFPIIITLIAFGALAGTGSASQVSRFLGKNDLKEARSSFDTCITSSLLFVTLACVTIWIFLDEVIFACGGSGHVAELTKIYLKILVPFFPFQFMTLVLMTCCRSQGRPAPAMWAAIIGSLGNVVLNWIFIIRMGMGIAGAAWGTGLAQVLSFMWISVPFFSHTAELSFFSLRIRIIKDRFCEMVAVGLSPFLINIFFSVMITGYNLLLNKYGGELALSAMGIFFGIDSLLYMPIIGFGEGALPVMAYNYGAKQFGRLKQAIKLSLIVSVGYFTCSLAVAELCPEVLVALFSKGNVELTLLASHFMRIGYSALPLGAVSAFVSYILEALGKAKLAFNLIVARQILAYTLLFVLPPFFGADGVWFSLPAIDTVGAIVGLFMLANQWKTWNDSKAISSTGNAV